MNRSSVLGLSHGFDRDLKLLLYSMSARRITTGFLGVVRAIYFALLGFSPLTIGLLLSTSTFVSALHHVSFGVLSDKYGRKPFLLLGAVFDASRLIIFALSRDLWLIALAQGLGAMGEGVGAGQPVVSGYITDKVKARKRVSVFRTLAITNSVMTSIGSVLAGSPQLFQSLLGIDLVSAHVPLYLIGTFFSALSFAFLLPIKDAKLKENQDVEEKRVFKVKSWDTIMKYSLVRSTSGLGWGLIGSLLPLYFFIRFNVGSDALGPVYASARLISIVAYMLIPLITANIGDIWILASSRIVSAAVAVAFAFTNSYPIAAILLVTFDVSLMFTMPIRQSFATKIVGSDEAASAIGISSFARMGFRSAAPTLAGYMFEVASLSMPFLSGSSLMFLNGMLYYTFFRNEREMPKEASQ